MRKLIAGICLIVAAALPGCNRAPSSLFDSAGYHVRGDTVYFLEAFPGSAFEIAGADAASFEVFDATYARDDERVYLDGQPLSGIDAATFQLLGRPGYARDRDHVYLRAAVISDDPDHFELLDGQLAKDSVAVYWSDGTVLSDDPDNFVIISNVDYHLFTKDSTTVHVNGAPVTGADPATFEVLMGAYGRDAGRIYYFTDPVIDADSTTFAPLEGPYAADAHRVYWMGKPIDGADPATFRVLNPDFECSTDATRAYYRQTVIAGADPATFPAGRAATNCSETFIAFAE